MIYFTIAYLVILIFLLLLEDQFLYGPRHVELGNPPAGVVVENIEMESRRGDRILAWWSKAKDWRPEQGAVLFCHGNGDYQPYFKQRMWDFFAEHLLHDRQTGADIYEKRAAAR